MKQNEIESRVIFAKGIEPISFKDKQVRFALRTTTIKGYSGLVYGYHLSYKEKNNRWWTTYLYIKVYETDSIGYIDYLQEVLQNFIDKLKLIPIYDVIE